MIAAAPSYLISRATPAAEVEAGPVVGLERGQITWSEPPTMARGRHEEHRRKPSSRSTVTVRHRLDHGKLRVRGLRGKDGVGCTYPSGRTGRGDRDGGPPPRPRLDPPIYGTYDPIPKTSPDWSARPGPGGRRAAAIDLNSGGVLYQYYLLDHDPTDVVSGFGSPSTTSASSLIAAHNSRCPAGVLRHRPSPGQALPRRPSSAHPACPYGDAGFV